MILVALWSGRYDSNVFEVFPRLPTIDSSRFADRHRTTDGGKKDRMMNSSQAIDNSTDE